MLCGNEMVGLDLADTYSLYHAYRIDMAFETEARQGKTASSGACVPAKLPP